jgi:hypothetical protein
LGLWSGWLAAEALRGRSLPLGTQVINLALPLGPGTFLVASGGATRAVNDHFITLEPETDRQRAYRGQSYGVDLVKLGPAGFRASGWRPSDPTAYAIFGEPVFSPCSGEVLAASGDKPDMPVPETDTSRLEGNHVVIDCGEYAVLLAHLRKGSLRVSEGDVVAEGQKLGEVGNSGQSTEPHLHVHVQRLPQAGPILSGEPLHLTFDGRFPVRNARLKVTRTPYSPMVIDGSM